MKGASFTIRVAAILCLLALLSLSCSGEDRHRGPDGDPGLQDVECDVAPPDAGGNPDTRVDTLDAGVDLADLVPDAKPTDSIDVPEQTQTDAPQDASACAALCDDGDPCTDDLCDPELGCVNVQRPDCCPGMYVLDLGFEQEADLSSGLIETPLMPYPDAPQLASPEWRICDAEARTGKSSLCLSLPGGGFDNGHRVLSRFITREFELPAYTRQTLQFWLFMDVEAAVTADILTVTAMLDGRELPLWTKDAFNQYQGEWAQHELNVGFLAGSKVRLAFTFDSRDERANTGRGVFLDDIRLIKGCGPQSCLSIKECHNLNPCVESDCVEGRCEYQLDTECCLGPVECEDFDGCTAETCRAHECIRADTPDPFCCNEAGDCPEPANQCKGWVCANSSCQATVLPLPACCHKDLDCNDGDPCTTDICGDGLCLHARICCEADKDCDDKQPCTDDRCVEGACVHSGNQAQGCCGQTWFSEDMEDAAVQGFRFQNPETFPWQLDRVSPLDGTYSLLWEGKGASASASLSLGSLPPSVRSLSFSVRVTTSAASCATASFRVLQNGIETWRQCLSVEKTRVKLPVRGFAGMPMTLDFMVSSASGTQVAVWIDGISIDRACCADGCDDQDPCTLDSCPSEKSDCVHKPIEGCCRADAACDDSDPCTLDRCVEGTCSHERGCCLANSDCDDGKACTGDRCEGGTCVHDELRLPGCCLSNLFSEGFESGTIEGMTSTTSNPDYAWRVSPAFAHDGGRSLYFGNVAEGSYGLSVDAELAFPAVLLPDDDSLALSLWTISECEHLNFDYLEVLLRSEGVVHVLDKLGSTNLTWTEHRWPLKEYAGTTATLLLRFHSDGNKSLRGFHIDDVKFTRSCCAKDADCDDKELCTRDTCPGEDSFCENPPILECCTTSAQCDDANPLTKDYCPSHGGNCVHEDLSCSTDAACDDGDPCTTDVCHNRLCGHYAAASAACCKPLLLVDGFEDTDLGLKNYEIVNKSPAGCEFRLLGKKVFAGQYSLYFGNSLGTAYCDNSDATLRTAPLLLPPEKNPVLHFQLSASTEGVATDYLAVTVVDGVWRTELGRYGGTIAWTAKDLSLAAWAGKKIQLEFLFKSNEASYMQGVFLDELELRSPCCTDDAGCDDGNPCTDNRCLEAGARCSFVPKDGCCTSWKDCFDGQPCTLDRCTDFGGVCANQPSCCEDASDCDDGDDACTSESCLGGHCVFVAEPGAACCKPGLALWSFEDELSGFELSNPVAGFGWQTSRKRASHGYWSLVFSNTDVLSYGNLTTGQALSPELLLPADREAELRLDLWVSTQKLHDYFRLFVIEGATETEILTMSGTDVLSWVNKVRSLKLWQGKKIRLKLTFEADDSKSGEGVFVDNLAIVQSCL